MRKARQKYVEAVAKKDGAANTVATLEQHARSQSEIAKMKQKLHKLAKEEMVLDQELKEAIEKFAGFHPTWVGRMSSAMDALQRREEQRIDVMRRNLLAVAAALQQAVQPTADAAANASKTAAAISVQQDLGDWVRAAHTGYAPNPPPQYIPRASRTRMTDVTVESAVPFNLGMAVSSDQLAQQSAAVPHAPSSPSPGVARRVRALHQFVGEDADELDFMQGDVFVLMSTPTDHGGWWIGKNYGRIGWFPSSFVSPV